eukprot:maker-scaffold_19-snap-gene-2.46-mRNA-1 protein AED:0.14 eAED:0.14 QI:0/0/0/1/1/1/2/0/313
MLDGYMTLVFPSGMNEPYLSFFNNAQEYWNKAILSSGLGSVDLGGSTAPADCLIKYTFPRPFVVEGVVLLAELTRIDGINGTLARAGACTFDKNLPRLAIIQFDTADLQYLLDLGNFGEVIRHEMAHSYGFGSAWNNFNLVDQSCSFFSCEPGVYIGKYGNQGLADLGGSGKVEIEADGGPGTAGVHWDDNTYENELMTGALSQGVFNPASSITIKSFIDMGYEVDLSAIEPYTLPKQGLSKERVEFGMDVLDFGYRETSDWLANGDKAKVYTKKNNSGAEFGLLGVALIAIVIFVAAFAYKKNKKSVQEDII